MTIWAPGMRCVCIVDIAERPNTRARKENAHCPRKGEVCTVRAVTVNFDETTVLLLAEYRNDHLRAATWNGEEPGFGAKWFRPLSETRLDQFRKHLNRIPSRKVSA